MLCKTTDLYNLWSFTQVDVIIVVVVPVW